MGKRREKEEHRCRKEKERNIRKKVKSTGGKEEEKEEWKCRKREEREKHRIGREEHQEEKRREWCGKRGTAWIEKKKEKKKEMRIEKKERSLKTSRSYVIAFFISKTSLA